MTKQFFARIWPKSLLYRLLVAFLIGAMLITAASGWYILKLFTDYAQAEFDNSLADKLRFYVSVPSISANGTKFSTRMSEANNRHFQKLVDETAPEIIQIKAIKPDGLVDIMPYYSERRNQPLPELGIYTTKPDVSTDTAPDALLLEAGPTLINRPFVYQNLRFKEGQLGRCIGTTVWVPWVATTGPDPDFPGRTIEGRFVNYQAFNVVVAQSDVNFENSRRKLQRLLAQSAGLAILGLLIATAFIIRRGVRSVRQLEKQIGETPIAEKVGRFAIGGAPSEVQTVVTRLNELMNRVDEALEHERTFTSNAAHELRTPLAGMRTHIELALSRTRTASEYEDTLFTIKDIQSKMQQLVDNLLLLARLESGQKDFAQTTTTLREMFVAAWKPFFDVAADKNLSFSLPIPKEQPSYLFPSALLGIILRNLLQNAVDYTPEGGKIQLLGSVDGLRCKVQTRNTNPGLTPEAAERVFQPFWRADLSGDPNQHNAGIGLALCKRILGIMDGDIQIAITEENQVEFTCEFPVGEPEEVTNALVGVGG
jgi:signal transduction histidine kinase